VAGICALLLMAACSSNVGSPAATPPPRPPPRAVARVVDVSQPAQVRAEIIRWFSAAGYKDFQAEALAEHAKIESGFRPCAAAGGRRYTYQWSGQRLRRLNDAAGGRGLCPPLDKQLAFANAELRSVPGYSCFWRATTKSAAVAALRRGFGRGSC
jgi:hypothetical protein